MHPISWIAVLVACSHDELPAIDVVEGPDGVLIRARDTYEGDWRLEVGDGTEFTPVVGYEATGIDASTPWWAPPAADGVEYRLATANGRRAGPSAAPVGGPLGIVAGPSVADGDDPIDLGATYEPPAALAGLPGSFDVVRRSHGPAVDATSELVEPQAFDDFATFTLAIPTLVVDDPDIRNEELTARLSTTVRTPEGDADRVIATATRTVVATGRVYRYGDLHGHTNLSADGCEDAEHDCTYRGNGPANDFTANAVANGLDFAAMSDHAEYDRYYVHGLTGTYIDVWDRQNSVIDIARDGGFLGLVAYEYTQRWVEPPVDPAAHFEGAHLTVVFQNTDICRDYRVAANFRFSNYTKGRSVYTTTIGQVAGNPLELWSRLDQAAASCGRQPVIAFFHHSTNERPQPVDFTSVTNTPDPRYSPVVEIYSEHGSFECIDTTAPGCDFAINTNYGYYPQGAVQTALSNGWKLGFVAGTDSHDANPGSWEDGPGYHGPSGTDPIPSLQFDGGGLTGVGVSGELDSASLFEGLMSRHTIATTGPRPTLYAYALGADGLPYAPGDAIPAAAWPVTVAVDATDAEATVVAVTLVAADGSTVAEAEGGQLDAAVEAGHLAVYARLDLDLDGEPHRVWVSPFFEEAE
jgi:hypothetical protein